MTGKIDKIDFINFFTDNEKEELIK